MGLAQWTPRRLAAIWVFGIALQVAVIIAPVAYALHVIRRDGARLKEQAREYETSLQAKERADSVSRAEQVVRARAAGEFRVGARGDTVFAVVGMPSGRPDPQRLADLRRSMQRTAYVVVGIEFGAIPLILVGLTLAWLQSRRRHGEPITRAA